MSYVSDGGKAVEEANDRLKRDAGEAPVDESQQNPIGGGICFVRINPETGKVQVLLFKRAHKLGGKYPGYWAFTGGKRDPDESI